MFRDESIELRTGARAWTCTHIFSDERLDEVEKNYLDIYGMDMNKSY